MFFKDVSPSGNHGVSVKHHPCTVTKAEQLMSSLLCLAGVRMLDGAITDNLEGKALIHALGYVDIYSASWGPSDDGKTMEKPGPVATEALARGTAEVRGLAEGAC
jgi:hypothetical protein